MNPKTFSTIPEQTLPVLGTDEIILSRDGLNVTKTDITNLPVSPTVTSALAGKANSTHTHPISDVTGLQVALDAKQPVGTYVTPTELSDGLATKANTTHTHVIADTTGLQTALDSKQVAGSYATTSDLTTGLSVKANTVHTHIISDVTGLQTALDTKDTITSVDSKISTAISTHEALVNPHPTYLTEAEADLQYLDINALTFDGSGNIIANIIPRTDTYSNLVTSAVSGGGEIASPTDRPTILKFHGNMGSGVAYEFSPLAYGRIGTDGVSTNITDGDAGGGIYVASQSGTLTNKGSGTITIVAGTNHVSDDGIGAGNVNITGGGNLSSSGQAGGVDIKAGGSADEALSGYVSLTSGNSSLLFIGHDGAQLGGANGTVALGFFGKDTLQPTPSLLTSAGTRTAVAGGNAVDDNDTFTGGIGTSAYTIPQIVKALKLLGLLAE